MPRRKGKKYYGGSQNIYSSGGWWGGLGLTSNSPSLGESSWGDAAPSTSARSETDVSTAVEAPSGVEPTSSNLHLGGDKPSSKPRDWEKENPLSLPTSSAFTFNVSVTGVKVPDSATAKLPSKRRDWETEKPLVQSGTSILKPSTSNGQTSSTDSNRENTETGDPRSASGVADRPYHPITPSAEQNSTIAATEQEWVDALNSLRVAKAKLEEARSKYDGTLVVEKTKFRVFSDARLAADE